MATQMLAPFAPHLAEEIWEQLGSEEPLAYAPFPAMNEKYLEDDRAIYVIQINGKLRARLDLPKDQTQEAILEHARADSNVATYLKDKQISKVIFVPNKLLNIVLV